MVCYSLAHEVIVLSVLSMFAILVVNGLPFSHVLRVTIHSPVFLMNEDVIKWPALLPHLPTGPNALIYPLRGQSDKQKHCHSLKSTLELKKPFAGPHRDPFQA